jgi:hypothetical protein
MLKHPFSVLICCGIDSLRSDFISADMEKQEEFVP